MKDIPKYQKDYSTHAPAVLRSDTRKIKAGKMLSILKDAGLLENPEGVALDIGCSGGFFVTALSQYYSYVIGLDIDSDALKIADQEFNTNKTVFLAADSMVLPLSDESIDLVICNHVYEHVPDSDRLFSEIYRVLKNDGGVYFGAASRLTLIEPHYHLPFLSWLPKKIAHTYMRLMKRGDYYYENLRTNKGIHKLIKNFKIKDYTLKVIKEPDKYEARDLIKQGSLVEKIPLFVWKACYKILPGYIYILSKK